MLKLRWFVAVFLTFSMIVTACGSATTAPTKDRVNIPTRYKPTEPPKPSILRIGRAGSEDTLNPGTAMLSEAWVTFELAYSALYMQKLDGSFTYDLATSVSASPDNKVLTYKIKPGVKFHDGVPLTAKDVVFSYNLYKAHEDFPYMNGYTKYFDKVEAADDTTVVLTLTEPVPNIESQLGYCFILPEHIWSKVAEGKAATEFQNEGLIGSGPFKLVEYKQNQFTHLAKNPDYYGTVPKVDEVIFQKFENRDALVQAIKTGQVDMITEMPNTAVATLKNEKDIKLVTGAPLAPDITDIIFNQVSKENCPTDAKCTGHPALRDRCRAPGSGSGYQQTGTDRYRSAGFGRTRPDLDR